MFYPYNLKLKFVFSSFLFVNRSIIVGDNFDLEDPNLVKVVNSVDRLGVNFINILRAHFLKERLFGSFSLVTFGLAPKFCTKKARV